MKPVAIFRHVRSEGPGYFATALEARGIPATVVAIDEGAKVPKDARAFSGLVFMGGPMSVNDDLPWIAPALELIRDAVRKDVPVLGHCLGGQLMAKALGGEVSRNRVKEIGWGEVEVCDNAVAREWFGELQRFEAFHWHGETFTIPFGGTRVLTNAHCANQAFALGKHFALQCHVEMTEELVRAWVRGGAAEIRRSAASPAVQSPQEIERRLAQRVEALHKVADRIYGRWFEGLAK
ncbi:MAG: type 1 glutamine amidotransferase [Burkholderiales bacterium]|nr:type 1 glutamine amidotransferase [Burkholderiales bacterium]